MSSIKERGVWGCFAHCTRQTIPTHRIGSGSARRLFPYHQRPSAFDPSRSLAHRSCSFQKFITQNTSHVKCLLCAKIVTKTNHRREVIQITIESLCGSSSPHPLISVAGAVTQVWLPSHMGWYLGLGARSYSWWSSILKLASVIELPLRSETICYLVVMLSIYCFHWVNPNAYCKLSYSSLHVCYRKPLILPVRQHRRTRIRTMKRLCVCINTLFSTSCM